MIGGKEPDREESPRILWALEVSEVNGDKGLTMTVSNTDHGGVTVSFGSKLGVCSLVRAHRAQ